MTPTKLHILRTDGVTDTLAIPEAVTLYAFTEMIVHAQGYWTDDKKQFVPWHEVRIVTRS